jgi:hypothetical protein
MTEFLTLQAQTLNFTLGRPGGHPRLVVRRVPSEALTAAGKVHSVLPLCGTSHMIGIPQIAVNLRLIELQFIRSALGIDTPA